MPVSLQTVLNRNYHLVRNAQIHHDIQILNPLHAYQGGVKLFHASHSERIVRNVDAIQAVCCLTFH
jgi:hypothetical protein